MTLSVAIRRPLDAFSLDIVFDAPADGLTVLFGPSGAGKSATLAAIAGLAPTSSARVDLNGVSLDALPAERRRIGFVHQQAHLFPHMSVERNLRYGWMRATETRPIAWDAVIGVLGIGHLLHRAPRDLSGGERQRVALGRALLSQPRLLLLDEPVSALDAARRDEVLGFIAALKERFGLPILYVTHSAEEARRLGDWLVRIEQGRVVAQGPTAELLPARELAGEVIAPGRIRVDGRDLDMPGIDAPAGSIVRISW
ncbi:hypothetical protein GCM10011380_13220 [Sphingomonas metalli]|uniref:ABC transporter domain-containing protein n=1 Tax=Sphingomonas metalli TaxID=1779358 RepID=A0A916T0W0_9SPHN|nr:ATP-binding cassette domain-containing protein [Sphingomonas metalli]GGB24996.1 hypothetical protein GCM10011380_13220 [Sphingomonas metalli]